MPDVQTQQTGDGYQLTILEPFKIELSVNSLDPESLEYMREIGETQLTGLLVLPGWDYLNSERNRQDVTVELDQLEALGNALLQLAAEVKRLRIPAAILPV